MIAMTPSSMSVAASGISLASTVGVYYVICSPVRKLAKRSDRSPAFFHLRKVSVRRAHLISRFYWLENLRW
jgi:hypothetical protein